MKFNIAIGKSRHDKKWQNKEITWEDFCKRISETHQTAETLAEYASFTKERQDEIKDIGGFVGGFLSMGRRLAASVGARQLLTFDADTAQVDFWDRFCMQYDCAAAIYSTHKHTADNPRYRLLIPIDREVAADEYAAIVRRIASHIGIEQFDHTGYQPHRLMYWPSTSKDGDFVFKKQEGNILKADAILETYRDWQDISEWPMGSKEIKLVNSDAKKQGEPTEKPGLIGAFCRTFTIEDCVNTFLSGIYLECAIENRYTFAKGSTAAGVVVYDNKFTFSHHSTDPTCGMLCNAFDLVRLHKFKDLDEDTTDTPINKRPSFLAMCDLVATNDQVKQQIGEHKLEKAMAAFSDIAEVAEEVDLEWLKKMDADRKGNYLLTINNIALILEEDPIFKDNLAFDDFEQQAIFRRDLPWRKVADKKYMIDNDYSNIENYIEKVYKLACGPKLMKGLGVVLEKHRFHSVVSYLRGCKWDGLERIETLLVDYLGAEDCLYTRTVTKKSLVACCARVCNPGVKFDNVLTLVGEEGQGKSALWDRLGGEWFSDTFNMHMLKGKEAYEQIQGVWIIEIGELAGMANAEVEKVKGFLAARKDRYRASYGKTTDMRLRQCVFFASTNTYKFLKSQTGNRRFWPVETFIVKPEKSAYNMTKKDIAQIWAEAYMLYAMGEKLHLSKDIEKLALEVQSAYTEENPWVDIFENFLSYKIPKNWYNMPKWDKIDFINTYDPEKEDLEERTKVCKYELWEIALGKKESMTAYDLKQIDVAMSKLKAWHKDKEYVRFGNFYPRHKGSWHTLVTIDSLM